MGNLNETIRKNATHPKIMNDYTVSLTMSGFIDDDFAVRIVRGMNGNEYDFYRDIISQNYDNVIENQKSLLQVNELPEMPLEFMQVLVPIFLANDHIPEDDDVDPEAGFLLRMDGNGEEYFVDKDVLPIYYPAELFAYDKETHISSLTFKRYGQFIPSKNGNYLEFQPNDIKRFRIDDMEFEEYIRRPNLIPIATSGALCRIMFNLDIEWRNLKYGYGPFENALRRKCTGAYEDYHNEYGILLTKKD